MPKRIQRKRAKGWRMPAGAVYAGRPTILGNPFPVDVYGQQGAVDRYRAWLEGTLSAGEIAGSSRADVWSDPDRFVSLVHLRAWVLKGADGFAKIRGRDLACWCRPDQPCHVDVLLDLANRTTP